MRLLTFIAAALAAVTMLPVSPAAAQSREDQIHEIVGEQMRTGHLRAVIVRVTKGDRVVAMKAYGTSLTGEKARTDMRFRNGAVAFAYVSTLMLKYVDAGKMRLDDPVGRWLPDLPAAKRVTVRMLANQTSGYPDYEQDPVWAQAFEADPFHEWTYRERLQVAMSKPMLFEPGTNWSYSHTNFMILGKILAAVGGKPLKVLLRDEVLRPLGLRATVAHQTGRIPQPVLHAYSAERRGWLGLPASVPFYEESTFWNMAWGTPVGATQTTDITDLARSARGVGTGQLLSRKSYRAMTAPRLLGFGHRQDNCAPACFTQVDGYNYGLGIVRSGDWLLQNPLLGGYAATMAYLPDRDVAIAVATTFKRKAFAADGSYPNASDAIFRRIGAVMAPAQAPPVKR